MRKLKLQMQVTPNGLACGPNGEMDHLSWNWGDDIKDFITNLTDTVDCIIMGSNLAQGFIPHWGGVASNPEDPEYQFGKLMTDTPKVVFSKTMKSSDWPNTTLANGELSEEISQLKNQSGKDIIVYGGASFVSSLINENLIDDYYLFVNPTAIGQGKGIFNTLNEKLPLKLAEAKAFDCGIALLHYQKI